MGDEGWIQGIVDAFCSAKKVFHCASLFQFIED